MGVQTVRSLGHSSRAREHTLRLLDDLDALERLIAAGGIETGIRRIGAEQELFLTDAAARPAPVAMEVLAALDDPHVTTELGRYNLEINLDPLRLEGDAFGRLQAQLERLLRTVSTAASTQRARIALAGILPTLRKSDLTLENMAPLPRYRALNDAMRAARGGSWHLQVKGIDELASRHDSVMFESCCTSFQIHLQVEPAEFAHLYNVCQLVTAPVLAAATNSPVLFGRRLWHETRVPLFQQSIDTRRAGDHVREASPRVRFGAGWVDDGILDLLREDVVRFRALLGGGEHEDPFAAIEAGEAPRLRALSLHNGTVYRWNRGCYGVTDGVPHLRIEMRALPSGPSVIDEIANAALFIGALLGLAECIGDVREVMPFATAKTNFYRAAKGGLDAHLTWREGRTVAARELLLRELVPLARQGLASTGLPAADADRYLDVVEARVRSGVTGSRWTLDSYQRLAGDRRRHHALALMTEEMIRNQARGHPAHEWALAGNGGDVDMDSHGLRVEDIMTTEVFSVGPDEPVELVGKMMAWRGIRHVPVEDDDRLLGLVTCFEVLEHLGRRPPPPQPKAVAELMRTAPATVAPETGLEVALAMIQQSQSDCLPVVRGDQLVGIVTERDFIDIAARLLSVPGPAELR